MTRALYLLLFSGCGLCVATGHFGVALVLENAGIAVVALTHKWVRL